MAVEETGEPDGGDAGAVDGGAEAGVPVECVDGEADMEAAGGGLR